MRDGGDKNQDLEPMTWIYTIELSCVQRIHSYNIYIYTYIHTKVENKMPVYMHTLFGGGNSLVLLLSTRPPVVYTWQFKTFPLYIHLQGGKGMDDEH